MIKFDKLLYALTSLTSRFRFILSKMFTK